MGPTHFLFRRFASVLCAAALSAAVAAACSPSSAPAPPPTDSAPPPNDLDEPASRSPEVTWPTIGWLVLDLEAEIALDPHQSMAWTAGTAARWDATTVEVWTDSPDPADPPQRLREHRREANQAATIAALRGMFHASLADGLVAVGDDDSTTWTYEATYSGLDTVVRETWRIGVGPAPWLAGGGAHREESFGPFGASP
ncbi:MAG: hypothetical protein AAGC53_01790 [Actinomycetota bacterium]